MLLTDGKINDGLIEVQNNQEEKSTPGLDIRILAKARAKEWGKMAADTGDNYYGVGSEPELRSNNWEPINTSDFGPLNNLGVRF